MVVLDPNARLGGSNVGDISGPRAPVADAPLPGRGFDGAHRCAAPVLSLEDCCLRRLGRSWARVEAAATEFCAERLREQVHSTVARFRRVRELALKDRQARRERQEPLSGSSGEEP
ncbi:unnamed protein product [Prorocentrum cordatum]|uniref:Uncharacterized protein n=1 Tax=Prorocentrum cordatum TaxID=2364126 RepID=A0ABN9PJ08_9DINO|nr:unnamed protein product [Polarella glacialis]